MKKITVLFIMLIAVTAFAAGPFDIQPPVPVVGYSPQIVDGSQALSLTDVQVNGTLITNTGQGVNNISHTLPTIAAGQNFMAMVGEAQGASYWRFTAASSSTLCLNGTCDKNYAQIAAPTRGASLLCRTMQMASTGIKTSAALAIGGTITAVATGAFTYDISGTGYSKTAVAAGTAPGNDVVPQNKYGCCAFDIGSDGTIDAIEASANATGYNTADLAVAGLPAV